MFSKDKIHITEVIKWGIFAGALQGLFVAFATLLYANRFLILQGIPAFASFFLISLIVISAIVTSIIVFAHPIFQIINGHYKDAALTVITTLLTILGFTVAALFYYQVVFI